MARVRTSIGAALLVCSSMALGIGVSWAEAPRPFSPDDTDKSGEQWKGAAPKGRLGVVPLAISPDLRQALGAPSDHGTLIDRVAPDSPAAKAGVKAGDVIAEVDGKPVEDRDDIVRVIAGKKAGEPVIMRIIRNRQSLVIASKLEADAPVSLLGPQTEEETRDLPGGGKLWSFRWRGDGDDPMPGFAMPFEATRRLEQRIDELERKIEALEKRLDAR